MVAYYLMFLHGWHEAPAGSWTEAAAGDFSVLNLISAKQLFSWGYCLFAK